VISHFIASIFLLFLKKVENEEKMDNPKKRIQFIRCAILLIKRKIPY